jgi:hypothetical protein
MQRSVIRDQWHEIPDYASLHPGYSLYQIQESFLVSAEDPSRKKTRDDVAGELLFLQYIKK